MLKIIESNELPGHKPGGHEFHKSQIDSLLGLLKVYQKFTIPLEDRNKASFVIADHKEYGIYGGAVFYLQKFSATTGPLLLDPSKDKIKDILLSLEPAKEEFWTARLCLSVAESAFPVTSKILKIHEDFYKNLLRYFIAFGKNQKINFLALTMQARDYVNTKTYGWPYALEIKAKESPDRLFHGLLALQGKAKRAPGIISEFQSFQNRSPANAQEQTHRHVL